MDDENRTPAPDDTERAPSPEDVPESAAEKSALAAAPSAPAAPARNIFAPSSDLEQEVARAARRRAAMWGFGTGMVMLVIVALCLVLAILAGNSVN